MSRSMLVLSLMLGASGCGAKAADEGGGEVKTVPRPPAGRADAGSAPQLNSCEEGDDCRAGQSCTRTCGVHQLGDSHCSCMDQSISCTECVLNPAFAGMLQDATEFCADGIEGGDPCATKGATCIAYDSDIQLRMPCLCWRGKSGLEWDCDDDYPPVSTPAFFKDRAPPSAPRPPPPDGGGFGPPP